MSTPTPTEPIALPIDLRTGRRARIGGCVEAAGIGIFLVVIVGFPLTAGPSTWTDLRSMRQDWTIAGPACPVVAQVSLAARGARPPTPFVYQQVGFAYQIADVSCEAIPEGYFTNRTYPVCQFDAPAAIEVTTGARRIVFEPGIGHRATVTVRHGQVSCAMGGWFRPGLSRPG